MHLNFIAGVIGREKLHSFEKMIWRVSFGNVILKTIEIDEMVNTFKVTKIINYESTSLKEFSSSLPREAKGGCLEILIEIVEK